jgi:hypothetical protein
MGRRGRRGWSLDLVVRVEGDKERDRRWEIADCGVFYDCLFVLDI